MPFLIGCAHPLGWTLIPALAGGALRRLMWSLAACCACPQYVGCSRNWCFRMIVQNRESS